MTSISSNPMPGVEVQANALWTVLAGFPLKSAGTPIDIALILALIAIPATIGARKSGLVTLAGSIGLLVIFLAGVQLAFNAGWIAAVTYPVVGLAITAAGMVGVDAYIERRQRAALERALGDLLPPQSPPAFFISYRRDQNTWQARDIRRELARRYGDTSVFMDTSSIEYGDFSRTDRHRHQRVQPDARADRTTMARTHRRHSADRRPERLGAPRDRSRPTASRSRHRFRYFWTERTPPPTPNCPNPLRLWPPYTQSPSPVTTSPPTSTTC